NKMKESPTRIGASGLQAAHAQLVVLLSLQLISPSNGVLNDSYVIRSTQKWKGLEHLSQNRSLVFKIFCVSVDYLRYFHDLTRWGKQYMGRNRF
ncbi:MAG: hypothetical protein EZS28_045592, partial [Streblomastix strix]